MHIIGLNGGMGCGKSTAAKFITDRLSRPSQLVKFAQPLYDIQDYIYSRIEAAYTRPADFVKDRKLLQWIGTDWGRNTLRDTIWIDLWRADVKEALEQGFNVICDDVRFDNEAQVLRELGGTLINIKSPTLDGRKVVTNGITQHASEAGVNPTFVDHFVANDGSLERYFSKLTEVLGMAKLT